MTVVVKDARRKLKGLAQATANEIFKVGRPERADTTSYFHSKLKDEIEDRETREQVEMMISEGCPNADD
jgi:hypothetical protein